MGRIRRVAFHGFRGRRELALEGMELEEEESVNVEQSADALSLKRGWELWLWYGGIWGGWLL